MRLEAIMQRGREEDKSPAAEDIVGRASTNASEFNLSKEDQC